MGFNVKEQVEVGEGLDDIVVLDFETTGLKAGYNRAIEVGAVKLKDFRIVDEFQQLMNPNVVIDDDITGFTGITEEMLKGMPSPEDTMPKLAEFIGQSQLVAHNASFDSRFLKAEMEFAGIEVEIDWLCTLMLSRRLMDSENYKLGTLIKKFGIKETKQHRALNDSIMTAHLFTNLIGQLTKMSGIETPNLELVTQIMKKPKKAVRQFLAESKVRNS